MDISHDLIVANGSLPSELSGPSEPSEPSEPSDPSEPSEASESSHHKFSADAGSQKSIGYSGVSATSGRAIQRDLRQFPPSLGWSQISNIPPVPFPGHAAYSAAPFDDSRDSRPSVRQPKPDKVAALWSTLYDRREKIWQRQQSKSQLLSRFEALGHKKVAAENDFYQTVLSYSLSKKPLPQDVCAKLIDGTLKIQSEYNSVQAEYLALQADINQQEPRVRSTEVQFFDEFVRVYGANLPVPLLSQNQDESAQPPERTRRSRVQISHPRKERSASDMMLLGISGDRPVDVHPRYRRLLASIGDRNLAEEGYSELILHRRNILSDLHNSVLIERRRRGLTVLSEEEMDVLESGPRQDHPGVFEAMFGAYLDESDMEYLVEFDSQAKASLAEIGVKTQRVDRLRKICIDIQSMPKHMSASDEYVIFGTTSGSDSSNVESAILSDMPPRGEIDANRLGNAQFPVLLSNPKHVLAQMPLTARSALRQMLKLPGDVPDREQLVGECVKEYGITTLLMRTTAEDKSDFINRWLLQQLRTSPMGAELLYSIFTAVLKVVNRTQWEQDVLRFWALDDGNRPKNVFFGLLTSSDSVAPADSLDYGPIMTEGLDDSRLVLGEPRSISPLSIPPPKTPTSPTATTSPTSDPRTNPVHLDKHGNTTAWPKKDNAKHEGDDTW